MKIGFTGTRFGMTVAQKEALKRFLIASRITEAHHGDCVGADAEFHEVVALLLPPDQIIIHPPVDETHRAFAGGPHNQHLPAKTHLARNRDIVNVCDEIVAGPLQSEWQPRGGTWYTVDFAHRRGVPVWIIWPDGTPEKWKGQDG